MLSPPPPSMLPETLPPPGKTKSLLLPLSGKIFEGGECFAINRFGIGVGNGTAVVAAAGPMSDLSRCQQMKLVMLAKVPPIPGAVLASTSSVMGPNCRGRSKVLFHSPPSMLPKTPPRG